MLSLKMAAKVVSTLQSLLTNTTSVFDFNILSMHRISMVKSRQNTK